MKTKSIVIFLAAISLFVSACDPTDAVDNKMRISQRIISVDGLQGESEQILVESDSTWTACTVLGEWLHLETEGGEKGTIFLKFSFDENLSYDSRLDSIVITRGRETHIIEVKQNGRPAPIDVSSITLSSLASQSGYNFVVNTGRPWEILCPNAPSWLEITPLSGDGNNNSVSVRALSDNSLYTDRETQILFTMQDIADYEISVYQTRTYLFTLSSTSSTVSAEGGNVVVNLTSNVNYTCEIPFLARLWITRAKPVQDGMTITETFTIGEGVEWERSVTIQFKSGYKELEFTISQDKKESTES